MNAKEIYESFLDSLVDKKIVVFGASIAAYKAINTYMINESSHILYFCDNDPKKWGTSFLNKEVCPPERLLKDKDSVAVLIASMYAPEIIEQLKQMGITENVYTTEILVHKVRHSPYLHYNAYRHIVPELLVHNYTGGAPYRSSIKKINQNIDKINTVSGYLSDNKSKYVYEQIIHNRKYNYCDYSSIMEAVPNMYFADGLFTFAENEVFVDAGVYDGQTSLEFIRKVKDSYSMIYAFEPDEESYARCENVLIKQVSEGRLKLIKKGLYSESKTIGFNAMGDVRSLISAQGNTTINVTKLDDEIEGRVTFIKMDIEGAEPEAIKGAQGIIREQKPKLAISIYHCIEHLWELPLLVKNIAPEYRLYVRQHTPNPDETVLYATI